MEKQLLINVKKKKGLRDIVLQEILERLVTLRKYFPNRKPELEIKKDYILKI